MITSIRLMKARTHNKSTPTAKPPHTTINNHLLPSKTFYSKSHHPHPLTKGSPSTVEEKERPA
jgi:hypothetical protein